MKKKIILGATLFLMLLTLFALSVSAAAKVTSWNISATSSDNVTATLYDDGSLVISGQGNMKNWGDYARVPWYYHSSNNKINSVTIGNGVTNIPKYTFMDCYALTSAVIPDSVTTIGNYAFNRCYDLESVVIGNSVTTIGDYAFRLCESLTDVKIGDSLSTIGNGIFSECYALASIEVSANNENYCSIDGNVYSKDLKTFVQYAIGKEATSFTIPQGVEIIGNYAFYYCETLVSVEIPHSVTTIGNYAFAYCDSLAGVEIPDSVTTIGDFAFYDCDALTCVVIPDSVITIGDSFGECNALTIYCEAASKPSGWSSDWKYSTCPVNWGIKDYGYTESGLTWAVLNSENTATIVGYMNLVKDIIIPENVNGYAVTTIKSSAFKGSTVLTSIVIPNSVTAISDYAFRECDALTSVEFPNSITTIGEYVFYRCYGLESIVIPDSVTIISPYAFAACKALTSVVIPNSVTTIGTHAFESCEGLTSVLIPNSVKTIGDYAFYNYNALTIYCEAKSKPSGWSSSWNYSARPVAWEYYVDGWDVSVNGDRSVMAYLESIKGNEQYYSLTISGSGSMKNWTSNSNIPWYSLFSSKIMSLTIENGVTNIGDRAFYDFVAMTSVELPDSVTTIGSYAFAFCDSLTSVKLSDSVTTIGEGAFRNCYSLTSVVIPDGVTTIVSSVFYSCTALTSIVIPDSVTSIGSNAFYNCRSLTSVVIPNSVTTIGYYAFTYCNSLTIYCEAASQPSGWNSNWNYSDRPVVWGYFDKEASLGEIFTFLGYSFNEEGSMAVGFEINYEALKKYEEKTGETLEIGVVFAGYSLLNGNQPLDNEGNAVTLPDGAVVKFDLTEYDYTYYDFVITDIVDTIKDIPLVISAYINNGAENKYIQENGISDTVSGVSYNEAKGGQF